MLHNIWNWLYRADRLFLKIAIVFLSLLLAVQVLMTKDMTRGHISQVDKLEGRGITTDLQDKNNSLKLPNGSAVRLATILQPLRDNSTLVIKLIKPTDTASDVNVLVNGKIAGNFRNGYVKVLVYDGDFVEIDATALRETCQFIVKSSGSKLVSPVDGLVIEGRFNVISVGKVKFKL